MKFLTIIFFAPFLAIGQGKNIESGIRFESRINWRQLLEKAGSEHKYIFVDCAASWCLPCKKMENEVFALKSVGEIINKNFLSVKVQMDTSSSDDEDIKGWYKDAQSLQQQFKVNAFPSFLFFSPNGKIVHRYLGLLPDSLFLKIAANALNPEKQYYTLLERYKEGQKQYDKLGYLANISKLIGENSLGTDLAKDYLHYFLNGLSDADLLQKKHFDFVNNFSEVLRSQDKAFQLMLQKGSRINEMMNDAKFCETTIVNVITKEEIDPLIWKEGKPIPTDPEWQNLTQTIEKKYGDHYAGLSVVYAQVKFYQKKKDRQNQIKYTVAKFDKYGLDTAGIGWAIINNVAYDLFFKHCNNKDTLNKMIRWMEIINKNHPNDQSNIDTYANLLYKAGRRDEAISWEDKATKLEIETAQKENRSPNPEFKETLDKMQKGVPTWVNN